MKRLPAFGRLDGDVFYAMGFSGQGVALTTLAGKVIAEAVAGQAELFDVLAEVPTPNFPGGTLLRWPSLVVGMLRSEEHTSELQSLMRNSYAVFCLKKKKQITLT